MLMPVLRATLELLEVVESEEAEEGDWLMSPPAPDSSPPGLLDTLNSHLSLKIRISDVHYFLHLIFFKIYTNASEK